MSSPSPTYAFPQRTPVFTAVLVLAAAVLCGWLLARFYAPPPAFDARGTAHPADFPEDQRWKYTDAGRAQALATLRAREHAAATTYGWADPAAGTVRLPLDRAIELTVREHARK